MKFNLKKCDEHSNGKTCFQVLANGLCFKNICSLFKRVKKIIPKFKKYHEMRSRGVIMTTNWISVNAPPSEKQKQVSKKWLSEVYPKLIKEILGE